MKLFYVLLILTFNFYVPINGQQVSSRLDSTSFLIGDQTNLSIQLVCDAPPTDIAFAKTTIDSFDAIEYINQSSVYKTTQGNKTVYLRKFLLAFFDTGAYYVPSIPVVIQTVQKSDTLYTNPIPIRVMPIAVDSVEVAPIKPIVKEAWVLWDAWPAIVATLLALFLIGLFIYRSKREKVAQPIIEIPKTPFEIAMIGLNTLADDKLLQQGKIKEHYAQLSLILRTYLENEFNFPALESTTREIGYSLDRAKFNTSLKESILARLQLIDLIKFAKVQPQVNELESSLQQMRDQVREIKSNFEINEIPRSE